MTMRQGAITVAVIAVVAAIAVFSYRQYSSGENGQTPGFSSRSDMPAAVSPLASVPETTVDIASAISDEASADTTIFDAEASEERSDTASDSEVLNDLDTSYDENGF
jgi:hypothetical protein